MKTVIVMVMHGIPPKDYPRQRFGELMGLHGQLEHLAGPEKASAAARFAKLDEEIRNWPRNPENDPFHAFSLELARELELKTQTETLVGFNEFCAPDVLQVLEAALARKPHRIIVTTPMLTRGGEHAEIEIPGAIQEFRQAHPEVELVYAWPFPKSEIVDLMERNIARYL